ncbi:MAG: hypothetical protein A2V73_08890 [candidate division Zixibacteria bacterium RBG_19FT_COMBO_42_43]|nr:MAG: hypothetical protein A2V73_08890 [candidate division Zixibacteria bacterium RBG_19FT_COMBO_42_43]
MESGLHFRLLFNIRKKIRFVKSKSKINKLFSFQKSIHSDSIWHNSAKLLTAGDFKLFLYFVVKIEAWIRYFKA